MKSVLKDSQAMEYYIGYYRNRAMDELKRADFMFLFSRDVSEYCREMASVVDATRPLQVPMTWSMYPERIWHPNHCPAVPCLRIEPRYLEANLDRVSYATGTHSPINEILECKLTVIAHCEPCWNAYKRWGTALLDSFYAAMRGVRAHLGFERWIDLSEPTSRYGNVKYLYETPKSARHIITKPLPQPVRAYGEEEYDRRLAITFGFCFTVPTAPEDEQNSANCHVVEEEVTETVTRRIKRMKCV